MGKASLIVVIGAFFIFFLVSQNINTQLGSATDYSVEFFSELQARNIANSTAEMLLAVLADSTSFRATSPVDFPGIWKGSSEYVVKDTVLDGRDLIQIKVTGNFFKTSKNITVYTFVPELLNLKFVPMAIMGAISANNRVETLGGLLVDGRNHDENGLVIPGGTFGVWTTSNYLNGGAAKVGGTAGGTDYIPLKKYEPSVVALNQVYPGGYPTTPDSVFGGTAKGYPPGTLEAIAKTGALGSQYVTDPLDLKYPLQGVTYVDIAPGGSWINCNIQGSGLLIVHSDSTDAVFKNLEVGPFKGIIVADDLDKIHVDIIGAIVVLTPFPASGNCIGNGTGKVLYSSQVVASVVEDSDPGFVGRHGFNRRRMPIAHWAE
jgi:hypothetical protein